METIGWVTVRIWETANYPKFCSNLQHCSAEFWLNGFTFLPDCSFGWLEVSSCGSWFLAGVAV